MRLHKPLVPATLIKRYKRFLADVELADGSTLTVHCPNPGAMTSCSEPGRPVWISDSENPSRKLRYTLEMIRMGRSWVGVNTANPNPAVEGFIRAGKIPELAGYDELRREVKTGDSRLDLRLRDASPGRPDCFVEVKSSSLRVGAHAAFPDAVTVRGRKHLDELESLVADGRRGVIFFFISRSDCRRFRPADEVDPAYGETLRRVLASGVEALAYRMRFSTRGIHLVDRLPIDL